MLQARNSQTLQSPRSEARTLSRPQSPNPSPSPDPEHLCRANQEVEKVARAVFKDVHVPSMSQSIRQRAFEVFFEMVAGPGPAPEPLVAMQADFLR